MHLISFVYRYLLNVLGQVSSKGNFGEGVETCGQEHRTTHSSSDEGCMHLFPFVYRELCMVC
jgi:hypothetical protein